MSDFVQSQKKTKPNVTPDAPRKLLRKTAAFTSEPISFFASTPRGFISST